MIFELNTYDPNLVKPMREEAVAIGFRELYTPEEVNREFGKKGYTLAFVNSVCGCAAGKARPGLKLAVDLASANGYLPENLVTVFAGMEKRAVEEVRKYFTGFPPSSPQIALLKDGVLISLVQRKDIENSDEFRVSELIGSILKKHVKRSNYGQ